MLYKFIESFKQPPELAPINDKKIVDKLYPRWRFKMFYSLYIAYVVFYLCRKNISVAMPAMSADLGYSNTELGLIGSALYFSYAFGKFINGVLADNSNVRMFLPTALILSGVVNFLFSLSVSFFLTDSIHILGYTIPVLLWILAFLWGFNGWFQSMGFPPIAKSLTYWFSNKERGTKWSLWSTSHEVGTFLSIILSGFLIEHFNWHSLFIVPAAIAIITGKWLWHRLRDKPQTIGLPDIELYRENNPAEIKESEEEESLSYLEIFKVHILFNRTMWLLAFAYVFVYIVRFGTLDWIVKYLVEVKQYTLSAAAMKLSILPLIGSIGTISAGFVSDTLFKGKRAPVNIIYLFACAVSIVAFKFNTIPALDYLYLSLIGIFTCGPQVLIGGLCAVESSSKKVASAATGFTGSFGYLGAIFSGIGTGFVVDKFGWNGAIAFWTLSALAGLILCIPMLRNNK
ncbi:MAG: MFS transporter [Candidatus Gastranaerophilales bacterium]|nr:MFS transporter [Candidatus Gastranaerophilales bacterium]